MYYFTMEAGEHKINETEILYFSFKNCDCTLLLAFTGQYLEMAHQNLTLIYQPPTAI